MNFEHLEHRWGGKILSIAAVGHDTSRGVARWFYIGAVQWDDGKQSDEHEIAPWAICAPQNNPEADREYRAASDVLSAYLGEVGVWVDRPRCGPLWKPREKSGRRELAEQDLDRAQAGRGSARRQRTAERG